MDSTLRTPVLDSFPGTIIIAYNLTDTLSSVQIDSAYSIYPMILEQSAFPNGLGYCVDYPDVTNAVLGLYGETTQVDIDINSLTWNAATRMADLSITIKNDGSELAGSYWYNIIVTEDSVISWHYTMTGCVEPDPGTHGFKANYVNNWIARKLVHSIDGVPLVETSWPANNAILKNCSFSLDPSWIEDNCNITVHVYQKADSLYKSPSMQATQVPLLGWLNIEEEESLTQEAIRIFPNPAKDMVNIHISILERGFCSLVIYNMNGQIVRTVPCGNRSSGLYNIEFKANSLPSGTYIVVLETITGKTTEKLVIQ